MALRLPVVVSGRSEDGATWSEPTETDDISTLGALFQLNQPVTAGDNLYIRSHRPNGVPVERRWNSPLRGLANSAPRSSSWPL